MKMKLIAHIFALGIMTAPFADAEQVRPRQMPMPTILPPTYTLEEIEKIRKQQDEQEKQQRQKFEEQKKREEQENLEARQKLNDKEGLYYSGKFAVGTANIWRRYGQKREPLFGGIGALGYRINPWIRFELEGGFYYTRVYEGFWTIAGQAYIDIPLGDNLLWRPYVNAGIGMQKYLSSFYYDAPDSENRYNVGLGIAYAMTKDTILDIAYRHKDTLGRSDNRYIRFLDSKELMVGIRHAF